MVQDHSDIAQIATDVAEKATGGLPQINVLYDGSFTNQIAWIVVTFFVLFIVVWRIALPKVADVLAEREERIANDLDTASRLKTEAEEVRASYEAAVADARAKAQAVLLGTKETIKADIAGAQATLDAGLGKKAAAAEDAILKARDEALSSIKDVATEVATAMISRLGGIEADSKAVTGAVSAAFDSAKGA
ncbi:MAG: hypothetical protein JKY60_02560 [Kordiimonadaceae bacterium]|nr:hypothetical protein [Kordiimonadaceae bacterium]